MQISCQELEERRRNEETRMQSSCFEFEERKRVVEQGCRTVASS